MAQERTAPAEYFNEFDPAALVEQLKKGALQQDEDESATAEAHHDAQKEQD